MSNEHVSVFSLTIINMKNLVSNETITYDDQDPPRMKSFINNLIIAEDSFCKKIINCKTKLSKWNC